jgi:GTP-binding protein TypA/BipA
MIRNDLRNIAIIAHVDHGKTTLVNEMLKQGGVFREHQVVADRVMDSGDLERERGITILAKNTSVFYNGVKINVVDTPGHADFGGEVERVLKMVNGVMLLVDAFEGAMPQTRFVLQKALELGHPVIVAVNKVDRPDARTHEIEEEILELLIELDATEAQLYSPFVYCSARQGTASLSPDDQGTDLLPLFDLILRHIPAPEGNPDLPFQMLVSSIDYNEYVGRIGIGRIENGNVAQNQEVIVCNWDDDAQTKGKITNLYQIEGLTRIAAESASVGDIVCLSGIGDITIGQTVCASGAPSPLPFVNISEPTVEMTFSVNDSPFAGQDGKFVTSRHLRDRLQRELLKDVSLRVSDSDSTESFKVAGRGEMHLSILIETMRREGYEFQVSTPHVLYKEDENGRKLEPIERMVADVPEEYMGSVMERMGRRKGELTQMIPQGNRMRLEFVVPARGLFGYRSDFLTDTRGEGILTSVFDSYQPYKGDIPSRLTGSLVAFESGDAVTYGLYHAQERGSLFISPGTPVYEGMIVGQSPKAEDLVVNVCKKKHVTNIRASGSDDALRLSPHRTLSLEEALEFIADDELIEVTPNHMRLRKRILDRNLRAKSRAK